MRSTDELLEEINQLDAFMASLNASEPVIKKTTDKEMDAFIAEVEAMFIQIEKKIAITKPI